MKARPRSILLPKEAAEKRAFRAQRIATFLAALDCEKPWELTIQLFKRSRSSQQNRYERGVACKLLSEATGYEVDEIHEYLCGAYFGWKHVKCPKTPNNPKGVKDVPIRTTTTNENGDRAVLNKQDFWDFVAFIQRFGAKHNVFIPDPDPDYWKHEKQREAA
jgi:hypothetical protein